MATTQTSRNYAKLRSLLEQLFRMDQADLDFGIYRIMNQKRDEIGRFLDKDLLPQVKEAFGQYQAADKAELSKELEKMRRQAEALGVEPDSLPKVQELREQLNKGADIRALEDQVFSHLANFFARYYDNGDFMSLRRYKEGVYAIPYEGEEVKLHWANADQYYIKTAENFTNYTFKLADGRRVHFELVGASTEQNNNKETDGRDRRFVLADGEPLVEKSGELFIRFEYRPREGRQSQEQLNTEAVDKVFATEGFGSWLRALKGPAPTERNPNRTLLERHLAEYTARNTFDYFIHKDLGGFLRRELDFYIKNEVMHLDDIENESAPKVEQYLSLIKVLRSIARKIIAFLEQLENFQKKLWLKKKFVIETQYCITLDRIPEELYSEIAVNDAQREEWVHLFAIDEIHGDLTSPAYSVPLTVDFLKANKNLVLDTRHFSEAFKQQLLASIDNLDEQCDGLLIHSENFQALNLIATRYRKRIRCIYIDPPYNTGEDDFLYKDGLQTSSWLSMLRDRVVVASRLLSESALFFAQIGDQEAANARLLLETLFSERKNSVVVRRGIKNVQAQFHDIERLSLGHDVIHVMSLSPSLRLPHLRQAFEVHKDGKWDTFWRGTDRATMRYELFGQRPDTGQWRWQEERTKQAISNYEEFLAERSDHQTLDNWWMENLQAGLDLDFVRLNDDGTVQYYVPPQGSRLISDNWLDIPASGSVTSFPHEKGLQLLRRIIQWNTGPGDIILDFFAGSGSTGHAALRPSDGLGRRYVLIEMGQYFDSVMKTRIVRAVYATEYRNHTPRSRKNGIPQIIKYIRLESYEDTLNNLELSRTKAQTTLLDSHSDLREEYMLSYMLTFETQGSPSLLNIEAFATPDEYKLKVERDGEMRTVNVDLVETFNWLLGLAVKRMDFIGGVRVVDGTNPEGEKVLILWRDVEQIDNDALDEWFHRQQYSTRDLEYDIIYVNGDNNLENWRRQDQTWKVRLIEEDFHRLMFDTKQL